MAIEPKAGLVIRYDFLWKEEQRAGREDGMKDRPCAIIVASKPRADGSIELALCPITHSPPGRGETGVEIPHKDARRLGLDDDRSWIKTHQVNSLIWEKDGMPFGVTPAKPGQWAFGSLPREIGKQAFEQVRENAKSKRLEQVRRDEIMDRYERSKSMSGPSQDNGNEQ